MSCSVQLKTRNTVKSKKVNNVIHRTTSETIRLGEPEVIINNSSRQVMTALAISPPPLKKSTCSFQITGVSLTQRTDFAGEDSADDLDESHTDDISRVTDNETPSFSEDTCSRDADDNYIGSCSALCSVTVIPSSSHYGLAIVPSDTSAVSIGNVSESSLNSLTSKASASTSVMSDITETQTSSTKEVPVTTAATVPGTGASSITTSTTMTATSLTATATVTPSTTTTATSVAATATVTPSTTKEMTITRIRRFPGTRFEVVNVETTQPFRRGRWQCMDYLDDSIYTPKNALTYKSPDSPEITCTKPQPQYTMTPTTTEINLTHGSTDFGTNFMNSPSNQSVQQNFHSMAAQQGHVYNAQVNPCYSNIVRQSQSYSSPISVPTQQLHHGQIDAMQAHSFVRQSSVPETPRTQVSNFALQNQYFQNLPMNVPTASTVQQPGNISVPSQQQSHSLHQPIAVQQNQGQLISGDMYNMQTSQMFYAQSPINQPVYIPQAPVYVSPPQIATSMQSYSNLVESGQNQNVIYSGQISGTVQIMAGSVMQQSYTSPQAQGDTIPTPSIQQYNFTPVMQSSIAVGDSCLVNFPEFAGKPSDSGESHSSGKTSHSSTRKSSPDEDVSSVVVTQAQDVPASRFTTSVSSYLVPEQGISSASSPAGYGTAATVSAVQSSANSASVLESSANVPAIVSTTVIESAASGSSNSEARYQVHAEAANNTSAIIDTKIEQAMDLVKSHLMYTVREEVEVLKVRIAELLDRINQLEMENSFLKANASPEVLNALNSRAPQDQPQGNIPSFTGGEGGASSK